MENNTIKILAIDDNRDNLITLKAIISEVLPQSVVYLELSGQGGIVSARKNEPDVILLDIVMPGIDGYEVCKTLKADEQLSETPIIFLTALNGNKQSRILALEAGGEAFLAKPIDATELKAQIFAMLKLKDAATFKKDVRLRLEELVQKRTAELKSANIAALNLLEDLNAENEIRKQRELELKESEEKFSVAFKTSPYAITITDLEDGRFIEVNDAFFSMSGYTPEDALNNSSLGMNLWVDAEDRIRLVKALLGGRNVEGQEFQFKNKNGEIITGLFSAHLIIIQNKTYILSNISDITRRKQAEEKLKLLNRAVEASSISVEITDAEGNINYVNPYFTEITGYSFEEVMGENPRFLKSGNQPKAFYEDLWNTILSGKDWTGEFLNKKKNGELFWEKAVISSILNSNGKIVNFVAIKEDITERVKIMEELVVAKEQAVQSDQLKSAFLANMSHEIRTPMNGILGFTELLLEPDLTSEQKETYINIVKKSGQRMLNTVNDIVEISKIEAGIVTVDLMEVDVQERLGELMRFFEPEAMKKGLKLTLESKLPKTVGIISTDQNKLDSIFTNLIKNAIKYTNSGTIKVGCEIVETHCAETHCNASLLRFYVKDTGIGISTERQQAVFERFIKADILDKDARQGSGLGLAITKSYVEMLGGKIWLESEEGIGSTFYFTLPCFTEPQGKDIVKNGIPAIEADNIFNPEVSGLKILIAEDDETSGQLISIHVRKFGNEIISVQTGREAVEACRDNPDTGLILMDIQMPELNGYEATRQIRQFNTEVIIIALTAFALTGDREKSLEAGCNDYISKPVKKDELQELIQKHLEQREFHKV